MSDKREYVLSINPAALERCFLTSDILAQLYEKPDAEYGLLGLAEESWPLQIIATPLLHQFVTSASVYQPSSEFLSLRREIEILSQRHGSALVPMAFIHRHPGQCYLSAIDVDFLTGTLIDQVAAVVTFEESRNIRPGEFACRCTKLMTHISRNIRNPRPAEKFKIEYGLCFSIIVNGKRDFAVYAARKQWCPFCDMPTVQIVPAALRIRPESPLEPEEQQKLKRLLEIEIEAKIKFGPRPIKERQATR